MNYSLQGSSVQGILQARILEWVAISFSRESSWPRNRIQVSCIAGRFFTDWATMEARVVLGAVAKASLRREMQSHTFHVHESEHILTQSLGDSYGY